jgi:putative ABC transport system permease protein
MKYLPLIWAGLSRKKLRTLFTFLSILVAFVLFGLLQGVNAAFDRGVQGAHLDRLVVQSRISFTEPLPIAYLPQIEAVPGIIQVAYASWFGGYYQDPKNFILSFPINAERYFSVVPEYHATPEQIAALDHTRTGILVGAALAKKWGWKVGDRVPLKSTIWVKKDLTADWLFDVVGILDQAEDKTREDRVFINNDYFDEERAFGTGTFGWFVLHIDDPKHGPEIAATVDKLFANSPNETHTQTEKEAAQSFLKQFGDVNFIATAIIVAVFFSLLFLTGNTMMQSVRDRIPEFAVLKTLGFSDDQILGFVLAETLILTMTAAIVGLAIAALLFPFLKEVIGVVSLPLKVILIGLGCAVGLALATGLPPALRARRLVIVDALAGR